MTARIAIIADIHHGPLSQTKRGDTAIPLLHEFARFSNDARPDFVLDLGDRISDVDRGRDLVLTKDVAEAFRAVDAPISHINGNHDREHLHVEEIERVLGQALGHQTLDVGGWRIIIWRADTRIRRDPRPSRFHLPDSDLLWLSREIQNADRPMLVASHVPVSGHSQVGNYYFENNPGSSTYPEAELARAVISQARFPLVFLSGHVHWNTITQVDGTVHLTQQSLTESFTTRGEPAAAMGLIELGDTVNWRVVGRDPIAFGFRPTSSRWTQPPSRPGIELGTG